MMENAAYNGRTVYKLPTLYMKKAEIVQFMQDHDINGWDQGTKQELNLIWKNATFQKP